MSSKIASVGRWADLLTRKLWAVKPGEQVLIVADTGTEPELIYSLASAVGAVGGQFTIAIQPKVRHDEGVDEAD